VCSWGGEIYSIDRDPDTFKHLLSWLRTGQYPNEVARLRLFVEAEFWGIPELITGLARTGVNLVFAELEGRDLSGVTLKSNA
jgi:hypothetical protein